MTNRLLLLLAAIILSSVSAQTTVTPSVSNATGDYFFIEDSITSKQFTCPSSKGCYIHCKFASSCESAVILPGAPPTWLHLECTGGDACLSLASFVEPTVSAAIICSASTGGACKDTELTLANTPTVNVRCDNGFTTTSSTNGACYGMALTATNAVNFNLDCVTAYDCSQATISVTSATSAVINASGPRSLYYATINGASAEALEVYCITYSSCYSLDVYAPSQSTAEYAFKMYCAPVANSCVYVKVYMISADAMTTNFMELLCPAWSTSSVCDIDFYCDGSTVGSYMTFDSENDRWRCNDQDCCPWTSDDAMVQSTTDLSLPGSIAATFDNGTVQVFDMDGTASYPVISCTASDECIVNCLSADVCQSLPIYAGATKRLSLQCRASEACRSALITQGPTEQADIVCFTTSGGSCAEASFMLSDTPSVNLLCDANEAFTTSSTGGNCYQLRLRADGATAVNIECNSRYDCYESIMRVSGVASISTKDYRALGYADIYGASADSLDIDCYGQSACYALDIWPPYSSEYAFSLYCSPMSSSCYYVDVTVPSYSAPITNYMELDCPRNARSCDVDWICLDLSTGVSTSTQFSSSRGRFVCNDNDCCPWTDYDNVIQSSTQVQPFPSALASTPTSEDSDGEHYTFGSDAVDYRVINCNNAAGCYITCSFGSACAYMLVYAAQTSYLEISCLAADACQYMYVVQGPVDGVANIQCVSDRGGACEYATLVMEDTASITLNCDNLDTGTYSSLSGSCQDLNLLANGADIVEITCNGYNDCEDAEIFVESVTTQAKIVAQGYRALYYAKVYAVNAAKLNVTCATDACYSSDIYPPYLETYDFGLYCVGEDSCYYMDVFVPNRVVAVDNYMQLICPTEDASDCGVTFNCQDTSDTSTLSYNSDDEQLQCRTYSSSEGCCPWIDHVFRESPRECTFEDGRFCGHTLFSKGYNIWSLESSGSYVLDVDQINNNTELWSDAGSTCTLSSLEFTSSYAEYSSFASSDSTSISTSYASGDNEAGGSQSQARQKTKDFATSSQSYIYVMSLSCQAATVSLTAYTSVRWNPNFVAALTLLPTSYSSSSLSTYKSFWDSYGTHVVKTAKLGGSIRGAVTANKCLVDNSYSSSSEYEVCLNAAYKGEESTVAGCSGSSDSESSSSAVSTSVSNTQITVRGGDSSEFTNVFNQFSEKSNEFQDWIRDLAVFPDIIGGDLEPIQTVIADTIALGGSDALNDALSSPLDDATWLSIATALGTAFDEYSASLATADIAFENCAITCNEGTVDTTTCTCNGCSSSLGCCPSDTTDPDSDSTGETTRLHSVLFALSLVAICTLCLDL